MTEVSASTDATRSYESGIAFPYEDIDGAIEIANVAHNTYGRAEADDIAGVLGHAPRSGGFRSKIGAAKLFGFLEPTRGAITVTDLGRRVLDEGSSRAAKAEAFLNVPLFAAIFEESKGRILPGDAGLEAQIRSLGVSDKMAKHARSVFQRSAQQAGFFEQGNDRLVRPGLGGAPATDPASTPTPEETRAEPAKRQTGGVDRHPLMIGLIQSLPAEGQPFTTKERKRWLRAVEVNFDFIYGPAEDEDEQTSRNGSTA